MGYSHKQYLFAEYLMNRFGVSEQEFIQQFFDHYQLDPITVNQRVAGSSPASGTKEKSFLLSKNGFLLFKRRLGRFSFGQTGSQIWFDLHSFLLKF